MKILQINSVCGIGSTGKIATDLAHVLYERGDDCVIAYGREQAKNIDERHTIKIGSKFDVNFHGVMSRLTDRTGFFSTRATKKLIKKIEEYNPDIIQLHNIHGYYINVEILFNYLAKADKPVVWTLHDCWTFTGHCAYFDYVGCGKWKNGCGACPQKGVYPKSYVDSSRMNFEKKKELFTSVKNMTIVTPSVWLAELVRQSYLGKYPVKVIYNGIDLDKFKPTESDFRKRYDLENKKIILGVASIWEDRKGLDEFIKLDKMLSDEYKIIIVGNTQGRTLPDNIIHISRTESQTELAEIYSAADVFVNPTFEDNFPSVNIEALACGTPVITYNTGGSPEAADKNSGIATERNADALFDAITENAMKPFSQRACTERAEFFRKENRFKEYIEIYGDYTETP